MTQEIGTHITFICEVCWSVFAVTCPTCPDRGSGRGVTVAKIREDFQACPTVADVNATARHYAQHVAALDRAGGSARTMAVQIRNLAAYQRRWCRRDRSTWGLTYDRGRV